MKNIKHLLRKKLAFILIFAMFFSLFSIVSAEDISENLKEKVGIKEISWKEKIETELWSAMETATDDDLMRVWLWLKDLDKEIIDTTISEETGFDPAIYENEERFSEEIVPNISRQIEERVGYEEAHRTVKSEQMNKEEKSHFKNAYDVAGVRDVFVLDDEAFFDRSTSLVDRAVTAKVDEYVVAKREIISRDRKSVV